MSGNAMEEGLIQQIHNPSHLDPSRIGFLAGALVGFGSLVVITVIFPGMPRLLSAYSGLGIAAAVGARVTVRITAARQGREVEGLIAARAMQQAETERQIAAMKVAKPLVP